MLPRTFRYPEHPEWSLQSDETVELVHALTVFRRLWPLFRIVQTLSSSFRDGIRGFVWDEDGSIGGTTLHHRMGKTDTWSISTVGVLPEFRRRGIARKLVESSLDDIRARSHPQRHC
jgi:ribosomal protein S18 acetylase RimI-like enzyme